MQCRPCGSWLARDGAGCRVSIAGKPAPTGNGCSAGLVGAGLPGMGRVAESASPASRLPQVMGAAQALWELACQRWGGLPGQHRRQPAPTGNGCSAGLMGAGLPGMGQISGSASPAVGSHRYRVQRRPGMGRVAGSASPASRLPQIVGAVQARDGAGCRVSIAGKPAPTDSRCSAVQCSAGQGWGRLQDHHRRQPAPTGNGCCAGLVGAGLPAMGQVAGLSSPQAAPSG